MAQKTQVPYQAFLVTLNESNNYEYSVQLQPPISNVSAVKFVGDFGLMVETNFLQDPYVLDQTTTGEQVSGLASVGDTKIKYMLRTNTIYYINIKKYQDTSPPKDTYSIGLLFLQ